MSVPTQPDEMRSPVGLIHEHYGRESTEFRWENQHAVCVVCGRTVEIVQIERRLNEYTAYENGVEVRPAHSLRRGKVQDESAAVFCTCEKNPPSILVAVDGVDGWARVQRCEPDPDCPSHGSGM